MKFDSVNALSQTLLNEFWKLKKQKRTGWLLPSREIDLNKVESVADHSWGAAFMAMLFLPNSSDEMKKNFYNELGTEEYDRDKIIQMLIVHDLAEAYTGDIPLPYKSKKNSAKERERIEFYSNMALRSFENLTEICRLWKESEDKTTYNARLAKDIDRLECYLQLYIYKDIIISKKDVNSWERLVQDWEENLRLTTEFGKYLKTRLKDVMQ